MRGTLLLAGYVVKVAVKDNRWQITVIDLRSNETRTFHDFATLAAHLEVEAAGRAVPDPLHPLE